MTIRDVIDCLNPKPSLATSAGRIRESIRRDNLRGIVSASNDMHDAGEFTSADLQRLHIHRIAAANATLDDEDSDAR